MGDNSMEIDIHVLQPRNEYRGSDLKFRLVMEGYRRLALIRSYAKTLRAY